MVSEVPNAELNDGQKHQRKTVPHNENISEWYSAAENKVQFWVSYEIADTEADMTIFEIADNDMNFLNERGHAHGADKPRRRVSIDFCWYVDL